MRACLGRSARSASARSRATECRHRCRQRCRYCAGHVVDTVTCRSADHPYADERPDEGDGCHQFGCPWASAAVGRRWVNHYRATDTRDSGRGHAGRLALCCEKAGRAKGVRRTPTSATLRRSTVLRRHRTGLLDALLPVRCFTVVDSVKTSVLRKS